MTMRRVAYVGTVALFAQVLWTQGCGGNNPSSPTGGTGGVTSTGGTTDVASTGGTTTPVTTSAGGATTPVTTGTGGSGGTTGTNPYQPSCTDLLTAANVAPTKNGICVAADPQLCYKTCGPNSIGYKSETCSAGVYNEQSGCGFLTGVDYSCYKVPTASDGTTFVVDPTCPATVPQASTVCSVHTCILCNVNGGYLDSGGAAKTGYCVCPEPSATTGVSKWSCASSTAWPCPAGQGC
ncbi:MAG TPA: hypothetical protein VF550_06055 [Polyangia bacterium]